METDGRSNLSRSRELQPWDPVAAISRITTCALSIRPFSGAVLFWRDRAAEFLVAYGNLLASVASLVIWDYEIK